MAKFYSIYWMTQEGLIVKLHTDTADACEEALELLLQILPETMTDDLCILKDEYALYEVEGSFPIDCIDTGSLEYCEQLQQQYTTSKKYKYIPSKKYNKNSLAIIEI